MRRIAALALICLCFSAQAQVGHITKHKRNNHCGYWTSDFAYVQFRSKAKLAKFANKQLAESVQLAMKRWLESANEMLPENGKPEHSFMAEEKPTVTLATTRLIGEYQSGYQYAGGAHPSYYFAPHAFGYVNGVPKALVLDDLVAQGSRKAFADLIIRKLRKAKASSFEDPSVNTIDPKLLEQFVPTKTGILYLFSPYDVASWAEGPFQIKISKKELKPFLKSQNALGIKK